MSDRQHEPFQLSFGHSLREGGLRLDWKPLVSTFVFALCISSALVSYDPYSFRWDDSDYLWRSIALSKAFWSGNAHAVRAAMVSVRPPVMTFLGLPWGPLASWDAAVPFLSLAQPVLAAGYYLLASLRQSHFGLWAGSIVRSYR